MDGCADTARDAGGIRAVELAVEVEECKSVHERPDGGRQGLLITLGKGAFDDGVDVGRDRGCRGRAFAAVAVARPAEHHSKQRRALAGELDVRDCDGGKIVWRGWRRVCRGQLLGKLTVSHCGYGRQERVTVGIVPVRRGRGDPGPACDTAQR